MSYYFDTSGSQIITYDHVSEFDNLTKCTWSYFIKMVTATTYTGVLKQISTDFANGFAIYGQVGTRSAGLRVRNNNAYPMTTTYSGVISLGAWTHVHIVYDGSLTDKIRIWINGTEVSVVDPPSASVKIGSNTASMIMYSKDVYLAEFGVWLNQFITDQAAITLLSDQSGDGATKPKNLVGYYPSLYGAMKDDSNFEIGSLIGTLSGASLSSDHPVMADTAPPVTYRRIRGGMIFY